MLLGHVLQGKAQESCSSLSGLHSRPGTHPGPPSPSWRGPGAPSSSLRGLCERSPRAPSADRLDPSASHLGAGHRGGSSGGSSVLTRPSSTGWAITEDTPPPPRTPQFRLHMPVQPRLLPAPRALRWRTRMVKTLSKLVGYV